MIKQPDKNKGRLQLAVVTNKDEGMARKIAAHFFGNDLQPVKGTFNGQPIKPDPAVVLQVLAEFGVKASEALFVGDSNVDIMTAKAAKLKAIGVKWGFRGEAELIKAGADLIIAKPKELLQMFYK